MALAVNFLAGQVKTHNDERSALAAIGAEMTANEAAIAKIHARHLQKCEILQTVARRGRGHKISATDYQNALDAVLPFAPPPVESTAWDLAQTSGVSANFDFSTRADLSRVYGQQAAFGRLGTELAADFRPLVFTRTADFFLIARNVSLDCTYVTSEEDRLDQTYAAEIKKL